MDKPTVKLVALDLDRTLLNNEGRLSAGNERALRRALDMGVEVVPSTGRAKTAVPEELLALKGLRYLISSNGACISDIRTGETLHETLLAPEAIDSLQDLLEDPTLMKEVFWEARPYTGADFFADMPRFGVPDDFIAYYRRSRTPVADIAKFTAERRGRIEIINLIFADEARRRSTWASLRENPLIEVTTSLRFNVEVGAPGVGKGEALGLLCERLGIPAEQVLSAGDNDNDVSMIAFAGVGVAVENASDGARAAADFITKSNEEDGVAHALEKFVF
ncbi:MAG: Cof-type HAD-IIB family hydrolase [Clostridiales Family XIII bacterium]|jgi:Cof subfamily protein (haloacid dehalogenase superfamily)|nr:Cof-type HAD-IIB family hydrolase [Clostridiales Family XIII bacterium]